MTKGFTPITEILPYWPKHLFGQPAALGSVGVTDFEVVNGGTGLAFKGTVAWLKEVSLGLPALDGISVVFSAGSSGMTEIPFHVEIAPALSIGLDDLDVSLRVQSDLLTAVKQVSNKWVPLIDMQNNPKPVEVTISGAKIAVSGDGDVDIQAFNQITMSAIEIGDTGIVIEVTGVTLHLSDLSSPIPGAPPGFKGVAIDNLAVHLGDNFEGFGGPDNITAKALFIGSSGFSGTVGGGWMTTPTGKFLGLSFKPKSIDFAFAQNKLTGLSLKGEITLPFFDKEMDVEIGYDANKGLTVGIDAPGGIFTLTKSDFVEVAVESIGIDIKDKKALVRISGTMTPLYGGLDWPSFEMRELSIDSHGDVKLNGGWIDLPTQKPLNFHSFNVAITKFGMGRVDGGGRWIGFSGKVNLIKGIQGNASVDGLRITLHEGGPPSISLNGVGVDMKVAGAFELKGAVKFTDDGVDKRFDGAAMLSLKKPELVLDTRLTIGERTDLAQQKFKFFAMYGGLELPSGIALGPVAVYGFAGLLAFNMKPGRLPDEPWYAMPPGADWYHKPTLGVNDFTKWDPEKDGKAFGAGLTIGTLDGGFTFNARALLVLAFPGPLCVVSGLGNLLKDRKELGSGDEPLFRTIAVLDEEAGEYTFGLDAIYRYDKTGGDVISIRGSLEAYFKKSDPHAWHIWLGRKDPRASRIQARIISLFEATSYFMIDAEKLRMGAWIGYDKQWNPSPLKISLQAWLDANAVISLKPNHFHADLWLHASIALSAFGVGTGLSADAILAADIMDPFHIKGALSVTLELPWPLKDISKDVMLEWGPAGQPPPIPIVLQTVNIQHLKSSAVWPLTMNATLVPSYDNGVGYLKSVAPSGALSPPPLGAPIVSMDARPSIAFGRAVHDDALIGVNAQPRQPEYEQIGDPALGQGPAKVRYALKGIVLEKWRSASSDWVAVAGKGAGASGLPPLFGSWGATPAGATPRAINQTNLMLWSRSAFDQTRLTGRSWNDWFADDHPNYPCVDAPPLRCYDFEAYSLGPVTNAAGQLESNHFHHENQGLGFSSSSGWTVVSLAHSVHGKTHALRQPYLLGPHTTLILSLQGITPPTGIVRVMFDRVGQKSVLAYALNSEGIVSTQEFGVETANVEVVADGTIIGLMIGAAGRPGIVEVCLGSGGNADYLQALAMNLTSATSVWSAKGNVLDPYTDYRLVVTTEAKVVGDGAGTRSQKSYAYFKTGGPPLLGGFTVPDGQTQASIDAGPDNLAVYVSQTVPATVGQGDAEPAMPRPVFRAYDVGVIFNEDYVDMLYRMSYRDLILQLLDSNGEMARDELGRALSFENPWGVTSELVLDRASASWIEMVNSNCMPIPTPDILHDQTLTTANTPLFLNPSTRYQARLAPLLLHDDFGASRHANLATAIGDGARIKEWRVVELDSVQQVSRWTVSTDSAGGSHISQSDALLGSANASTDCPPGSALIWDPASGGVAWKSLRMSAFVSTGSGGAIGLVFLYESEQTYYELTMRQSDGACKLIRWTNGIPSKLREETISFAVFTDIDVVIEVSDTAIRVFVDGISTLVHSVDVSEHPGGRVGLWCWNNASARFKDVRVEDQSGRAAAYGFEFVTSNYLNYFHLAHARRTPVWDIETRDTDKERTAAELEQLTTKFVQQTDAKLGAPETRQYEDLVALWLGPAIVRDPELPEINRILLAGETVAWLIRSPEPWDWKRSQITLKRTSQVVPASEMLGPVKITGAMLGMSNANDEFVDLLILEDVSLNGWRLDMRDTKASTTGFVEAPLDDPSSTWSELYTFTSGNEIKAGLRVRLYSGGLPQPSSSHTQVTMNIAPEFAPGIAHFPSTGADLRLVDRSERIACAIRILPETAFDPVPVPIGARMLRKGDATGLIVVPGIGNAFPPGTYALWMAYRRNISADDPKSIVLSQAGDTTDEQAFVPLY